MGIEIIFSNKNMSDWAGPGRAKAHNIFKELLFNPTYIYFSLIRPLSDILNTPKYDPLWNFASYLVGSLSSNYSLD